VSVLEFYYVVRHSSNSEFDIVEVLGNLEELCKFPVDLVE
jgi:hypothetical protein